ncbi:MULTISPECIES: 4-hydroxy-tetrahydrodipicolinate synthase [Bacillus]|uniref:4-hydroxy-tetrahydrodipicolinate synthase n=1 Tax=Bacillus TaxID=1386 RepID=UPI0004D993D0|nr:MULTISPECIES: 4-hydroxy-tetrahydrodipicolinate synthase [Bacillus]AYJ88790.1 4-hydroxy-tetrahydrodipicolinate synthase [Bacillus safensis]KEP29229.1 dihydrodipicolinate synthase [Bacillus safensis]MBZ9520430.1 4-hydroxy-tetrahydrodipicolinate synthase [Bacillus safensis]MCM3366280.1 4-hydroxy-tetrahydrodipicolinate synthase [Bacillus safensis]MCP9283180.1 4-hydroxy-tetrahydrodipicolinate synthase [Bacillus safensis]
MNIQGIIPAILTPLTEKEHFHPEVATQLVNRLIDSGVHGIFALGTNGEFHLFSEEEKLQIAETVVNAVGRRVPVFIGAGENSTEATIRLSNKLADLGVDVLSIITPYFVAPTQEELYEHFRHISENVNIPILLYNIPSRTGVSLAPETVARLSALPNVLGIKDSSGNIENIKAYLDVTKDEDFVVLAGTDSLILDTLKLGGAGAVAATANVLPETVVGLYESFQKGKLDESEHFQKQLQPLRATFGLGTLPAPLKKAAELYGIPVGPPRSPVKELSGEALEAVAQMVEDYRKQGKAAKE